MDRSSAEIMLDKALSIFFSSTQNFNGDSLTEWLQQVKADLINEGITIEGLAPVAPISAAKDLKISVDKNHFNFNFPSDLPSEIKDNPGFPPSTLALIIIYILSDSAVAPTSKGISPSPSDIIGKKFIPSLNNAMISDFVEMTKASMKVDKDSGSAVYVTKNGHRLSVTSFNDVLGSLSVSANILFNHAATYLLKANYYKGPRNSVIPAVEMPLDEYARLRGDDVFPHIMATKEEQEREDKRAHSSYKKLKDDIKRDLKDIQSIHWKGKEKGRGQAAGDYADLQLISGHGVKNGMIYVNFDFSVATYLLHSYIMQYPTVLYTYDRRKPNAYAIAFKIAAHNSITHNFTIGTNNTLSVATLLASAPEIPTIEDLKSRGERGWKYKIKSVLEKALNESVSKGFLSKWEYRDPKSKTVTTYTPEQANSLTYLKWYSLMVDYTVIDPPDQAERSAIREAKAEANRIAAEAKATEPPKRKRGRPRKNPENKG